MGSRPSQHSSTAPSSSSKTPAQGVNSHDSAAKTEDSKEPPHQLPNLDVPAQFKRRNRRVSVSAEVDKDPNDVYIPKIVPKSEASRARIAAAVANSFLFSNIDRIQMKAIIDSMEEKKVQPGDVVIKQGDGGDFFYIIETGKYSVWKGFANDQKQVFSYDETGSFGELALMYNCPRAATVKAETEGTLWAVDRQTFRYIIITAHAQQRKNYETFLEKIPLLKGLTAHERALIADCLERKIFQDGELVIKQGDAGDRFYLVERGEAVATQFADGKEVEVGRMGEGKYFGERALVKNEPRAANVKAVGELVVAAMDRAAFERLLGDRREMMLGQIHAYPTASQILRSQTGDMLAAAESAESKESGQLLDAGADHEVEDADEHMASSDANDS